jgi:hypothetical protein
MTTSTVTILIAIALSSGAPAGSHHGAHTFQEKKTDQKPAPGVAGRWTMSVKGGPHGDTTMGLALEQNGKKVSGIFATPHGDDLQVVGEFAEGTLALATPGGGESKITMTAKLKDDGTLDGYLSSQLGDMTWTARRASAK